MSNVLLKSKIKKFLFLGLILISLFFIFLSKKEKSISPKLASLSQNSFQETFVDPNKKSQPELPEFILVQNNSFQSNLPPYIITPRVFAQIVSGSEIKNEIRKHIVEKGESLWSIAKKYDLKIETIIWANDLESATIYPGQELTILPVDGLIHIVKKGDTLESIAKKYEADPEKIALINELYSPDEIFENQALIIPDGKIPFTSQIEITSFTNLSTNNFYGKSHAYPYGYCTWWVAQRRAIPSWGHAKDWLNNAISSGFPVCKGSYCTPRAGAVIALRGSSLGHVGYVERVEGNRVIFSEMNYVGWGKMNYRSLRIGDPRILGYIY